MDGAGQPCADELCGFERQRRAVHHNQGAGYLFEPIHDEAANGGRKPDCGRQGDFAEVTLLMTSQQLQILKKTAALEGMTTGQFLRRVIHNGLTELSAQPPRAFNVLDAAPKNGTSGNSWDHFVSDW